MYMNAMLRNVYCTYIGCGCDVCARQSVRAFLAAAPPSTKYP